MKFSHTGHRLSGIVLPLSAIRSDLSPGCGEFPDLVLVGDLASAWGLNLVQLLPVNDSGFQNSPYFALSAFALHPIYIRINDMPELSVNEAVSRGAISDNILAFRVEAEALVRRFSAEERVPYEALLRAKLELLRRIWAIASDGAGWAGSFLCEELDAWILSNSWVKSYAAFVSLKVRNDERPWWEWSRLRDPTAADIDALWEDRLFSNELRFWAWIQMRAADQFRSAAEYLAAKGIALMGDIPILMNADSADVWSRRACFCLQLSAGAPPDMYSSLGQNWGFPIYNWDVLKHEGYGFWTERLTEANKYYSCYRIDHVLGFFRIWALSERESTGALGRFVPDLPLTQEELSALGFSIERIRWMSRPHVPIWRLIKAAGESAAKGAAFAALERIGGEDLFLFKDSIHGERDIEALPFISPVARDCLLAAWRDRALFEFEPGFFVPTWNYRSTTCWPTLTDEERGKLEALFASKRAQAEELWEKQGKRLLNILCRAVPMLPCAEDLGSVPGCVPKVLEELDILGLRVLRWTKNWNESGQPYIPIADYPEPSVACPSVHDSSSVREWWESEADREGTWRFASVSLNRELGPCPERLGPEQVEVLLELVASSASRFAVYPIQDVLALSEKNRPADPKSERINTPGTIGIGNWSYRTPVAMNQILADKKLAAKVRTLVKARSFFKKARGDK
jgi:4-alpha-glucanotransferase